jgi:PAS domain S-box-containing protein
MEEALTPQARDILAARRDVIVEQWYRAIAQVSYVPLSATEVRARLAHLVDEAIDVLLAEAFDAGRAQAIGESLTRMHYIHAEVAAGTVGVLGRELTDGLPPEQLEALQPRLVYFLAELVSGYFRSSLSTILQEQEGIRNALLMGLRTAQQQLRQARDELEMRVEERTAELAQANEDLRKEIQERTRAEIALRESEEKYRELVENLSDIIYAVDREGTITYISSAVEHHLGYETEDVVGAHVSRFIHPEDMPRLQEALSGSSPGDMPQSEYRVISKSGEVRWMRASSRPILIEGRLSGLRGVLSDITERKQMERHLQESQARYRAIVQEQTDLICRFLPCGQYVFVNEAYARFYGIDRPRIQGGSFLRLMSPEELDLYEARIGSLRPDAPARAIEQQAIRADGQERWVLWSLRGMFDEQGQLTEVQAVGRDITERRRAEEASRESEERWRSLVQNAPDLVVTVDRRGDILFINRTPEGADLQPEDLVGTNALGYLLPEQEQMARQTLCEVFEEGRQATLEVATVTGGGQMAWEAVRCGPIFRNGIVTSALLVVRNISERKRVEEMKDNLIRDVSHEMRTPLAKVQMSLELLEELVADDDINRERAVRTSELATRNVRRLLETVEGILDLSRLEAGTLGFHQTEF